MLNAIKRAVAAGAPSDPEAIDHTLENVFRYTRIAAGFGRDIIGRDDDNYNRTVAGFVRSKETR